MGVGTKKNNIVGLGERERGKRKGRGREDRHPRKQNRKRDSERKS